ncbi:MAG: AmmeMemoRadiSam system radical SAM enzyme [Prevotella sp.]|nr:AmmeMemoRadiSam system radical SAM enzyme [Prevotella sp.]
MKDVHANGHPTAAQACRYYRSAGDGVVECLLCPHHCHIGNGRTGRCRNRRNVDGVLVSEAYGRPCALAIDPVEKKPLYHFHPGTQCLSIACTGCNFRCLNCQNHDISQVAPRDVDSYSLSPKQVVDICVEHGCPGIAYTYTEPLTYIEYVYDIARLAREKGLWNILVTAGYVCKQPLEDLLPFIDAANIDLKSFSDEVYQKVSGGRLSVVLDTILAMRDAGVWIELTNLLIPGINDDMGMIRQMCRWMVDNNLKETPLHFSRFFPRYRMRDIPPTPIKTLEEAKRIAIEEGLQRVYLGNV